MLQDLTKPRPTLPPPPPPPPPPTPEQLREQLREEYREFFKEMDTDKSDGLNLVELRGVLKEQGDYTDETALKKLFRAMDTNYDRKVSFEEADKYEDEL
jgi:Ca2+-binding EF-hand superfamily protein